MSKLPRHDTITKQISAAQNAAAEAAGEEGTSELREDEVEQVAGGVRVMPMYGVPNLDSFLQRWKKR